MLPLARQQSKLQIKAPNFRRLTILCCIPFPHLTPRTAIAEQQSNTSTTTAVCSCQHRRGTRSATFEGMRGCGCRAVPLEESEAARQRRLRAAGDTHAMAAFSGTWAETLPRLALLWSSLVYAVLASGKCWQLLRCIYTAYVLVYCCIIRQYCNLVPLPLRVPSSSTLSVKPHQTTAVCTRVLHEELQQ